MTLEWACGLMAVVSGFGGGGAPTPAPILPAESSAVTYEGRYASDGAGGVRLGFPGVIVHLRFRGSSLGMRVRASSADVAFDIRVDGGSPTALELRSGEGDYTIFEGGGAMEHTIELTRRNESWRGTCTIVGFNPGVGGELLAPAALPARKLLFIGDSVTCGELAAWVPEHVVMSALDSDARASFAMILARHLGAQCHLVSYGGRGVIRDWQGGRGATNAPQFYELALPDDPKAAWDHRRYVPDGIGIALGTNDFSEGIPDQNEFVNAYVEFILKVRGDAPNATIFVMDSPIVKDDPDSGPRRTVLHGYLRQVVERIGSPKVILTAVSHYPGVPNNGHPTGADHEAMAAEIEPVIRGALGW
jgi:lysophospholipase L1-like esterase